MAIRFHDYPPSLQIINTVHQIQRGAPQQEQLETVYLPPPRWETDQLSICQEPLRSTPQETQHRLWVPEMPLMPPHTPRARASALHDPWGLCDSWMSQYDVNDTLFFWSTGIYCHSKNKDKKQEGIVQSAFFFSCLSVMHAVYSLWLKLWHMTFKLKLFTFKTTLSFHPDIFLNLIWL